jgi:hypothetical protein
MPTTNILSKIRFLLILPLTLFILSDLPAQICTDEDSSNNWNNSWVSCQPSSNPNPARRKSHWLLYEFDQPQNITLSHIWNANRNGESNMGIKEALIDYSLDGTTWKSLGSFTFPKGTEKANYEGFEGPDFGGIFVSKVLISVVETYGDGSCASLAEVQFNINRNACYGQVDACGVCNGRGETTWYADQDGDGLGSGSSTVQSCEQPVGFVANADDECDTGVVGWSTVGPIFAENGCTGCHGNGAAGGLNLTSYATAVMGGNKCGPNILTGNTLIEIITLDQYAGCGTAFIGPSMNDRVGGNIDDEELELIRQWIASGAPEDCNCPAGSPDSDNDGVCDAIDQCPNIDNQLIGTPCDDGNDCTINDIWRTDCDCRGDLIDRDQDGICDTDDAAPDNPCTADGVVDGVEPAGWVANTNNDCDLDGISIGSGDLDDFSACINDEGLLMTAECNCGNNSVATGGVVIDFEGMNRNEALAAGGLPDGLFSGTIQNGEDTLLLQYPYMEAGEQICLTVGFSSGNGTMRLFLNNRLMTFTGNQSMNNYQAQEFCFNTLNAGVQTLMIMEEGSGDMRVDGSTYSACPCGNGDITDVDCLANYPGQGWRQIPNCTLEICEGQPVSLGTDRYETIVYQWRGPNGVQAEASTLAFDAVKPSDSGIYWLYYENRSGCDLIKIIELVVIPAPPVTLQAKNPSCGAVNGEIVLNFEDVPERNSIEFSINGENGNYIEVNDNLQQFTYSNLAEGNYDVWARWSNGDCPLHLGTIELVDQPAPMVDLGPNLEICEGEAISITPLISGSKQSYRWNTGHRGRKLDITPIPDSYADQTFSYRITVTDGNGCTATDAVKVKVNSIPKVMVNLIHPESSKDDGRINLRFQDHPQHDAFEVSLSGENGPYSSINDDKGQHNIMNLGVGSYDLWVRWDDGSCPVDMGMIKLKSGNACPTIDVSASATIICEGEKVRLSTTNKSNWRYIWSNGATTAVQTLTPTLSDYADETFRYEVTVTDQNGCMRTDYQTVKVRSLPQASFTVADTHCGKSDGAITFSFRDHPNHSSMQLSINGPSGTFKTVKDKSGTYTFKNLSKKKYDLWARWNQNTCPVKIGAAIIGNIPGPDIDLGPDVTVCDNNRVYLGVKNRKDWTYKWSNGSKQNKLILTPKVSGYNNKTLNYSVTVTDAFGCKATDDIKVLVYAKPQATYKEKHPTCGAKNGEITFYFKNHPKFSTMEISISGKNGKYHTFKDENKKKVFKNLKAGYYDAWVRWGNDSCPVKIGGIRLKDIPGPKIDVGPNFSVCEDETIVLKVNKESGWTYRWSNGVNKPVQSFTAKSGSYANKERLYRVTVTDRNKCRAVDEVKVTVLSKPRAGVSITHPQCDQRNGAITFKFKDHPNRSAMEFSITGKDGKYISRSDNKESLTISGLSPGTYDLWMRWENNDCPVKLTKVTLKKSGNCLTDDPNTEDQNSRTETITLDLDQIEQMQDPQLLNDPSERESSKAEDPGAKITSSADTPETDLQVFPNPAIAGHSITIRYYADTDRAPLKIMDPTGRLVKNVDPSLIRAGWNELQVGLENVSTGTYIVLDEKGNYKLFVVME